MRRRWLFCAGSLMTWALLALAAAPARHPPRMATQGRLDLLADAATGELDQGQVVQGNATVGRMNWLPQADRKRGYTVQMAVNHLGWAQVAIHFTPARSGTVTLTLMGPWEEASKGVIYKQEVLWDDLRTEGACNRT